MSTKFPELLKEAVPMALRVARLYSTLEVGQSSRTAL